MVCAASMVNGAQHQVAHFGGGDACLDGFGVAHFPSTTTSGSWRRGGASPREENEGVSWLTSRWAMEDLSLVW